MMMIWIVWSDRPLASFSSEERARAYIARHRAEQRWSCFASPLNAESFNPIPRPASQAAAQAALTH